MSAPFFSGRLALQQRVLPSYRAPFFELLAHYCESLGLFSGLPRADEGITPAKQLKNVNYKLGRNIHLLGGPFYLCYQSGLLDWLKEVDPQALIVEANPRYLATPAAVHWMQARARKVIGWGLGAPPLSGPWAGLRRRRRFDFLDHFDALIAYSRRGAEEYAALGFPRDKIFVAPNAAAAAPTSPPPPRPMSGGHPTILFVGRLQARKRLDFLLRACAEMMEPKPRLIIVGDGPERHRLQRLAGQVYPAAEFPGAKQGAELKSYFLQADLFVLPGTGGLAVQEAMSFGLPVIVARGDGTQDDLVTPDNGWQIDPEDYPALVAALRTALGDLPGLRRRGEESFRIVSQEINLARMVEAFVQALLSLK